MLKTKMKTALTAMGMAAAVLGASQAFAAPVVVNLKVTKNFTGGYNADIVLDSAAKAALPSNPTLTFSLGHSIKSAFGASIVSNTASAISLNKISQYSVGYTDTNQASSQLKPSNCSFAGQGCVLQLNGVTVWSPSVTITPTATVTPTRPPIITVTPTATPTRPPVITATPTATPTHPPVITVTPTPTSSATPTPTQATSGTTYNVDSIRDINGKLGLPSVLKIVKPGDTINLADGTYTGVFKILVSGAKNNPITLKGSAKAVLTTGSYSGYALLLDKVKYWNLQGFTVNTALKGIMLDTSSNNVIDGVTVSNIGQESVHFRTSSTNNVIKNSIITGSGKKDLGYGEGVYIGSAGSNATGDLSNNNCVENNTFSDISAEGIDIKEYTTGNQILFNTYDATGIRGVKDANFADSFIDIKGNNVLVYGNKVVNPKRNQLFLDGYQTHVPVANGGSGNIFQKNDTHVGNVNGYAFNIDVKSPNNTVCDDNTWSDAAGLVLNGTPKYCAPRVPAPSCSNVLAQ